MLYLVTTAAVVAASHSVYTILGYYKIHTHTVQSVGLAHNLPKTLTHTHTRRCAVGPAFGGRGVRASRSQCACGGASCVAVYVPDFVCSPCMLAVALRACAGQHMQTERCTHVVVGRRVSVCVPQSGGDRITHSVCLYLSMHSIMLERCVLAASVRQRRDEWEHAKG